MQRRDDGHGQPREQRHDVVAGLAAENAEFMLQANDFELPGIEGVRGARVLLQFVVVDLEADRGRIIVSMTVIGHRHDGGFHACTRLRDSLLQIGSERSDATATRQ